MARFFINRPIVAIVIAIVMVIVGVVALLGLPISQYPNIVPPEIFINTTYVGADAQTVEQSVATPIEQEMSGVDNMNYMYSLNANNGELKLYVNFDVNTDPNIDQVLTQMRESQAEAKLPADVRNYGVTVKKSTAAPLMVVDLISPQGTYDATFLANYAYINLNDQMTRVAGIASVTVFGAGQYAMRFWVRPDQLAKLNITIPEIVDAIQKQNTVNPSGQVGAEPAPKGQEYTYAIRSQGRLENPEEFERIVLRANPGRLARPPERRGPHRTGVPELCPPGAFEWQGRRGPGPLPAPGHQCHPGGGWGEKAHGAGQEVLSAGYGLRYCPGHHPGGAGRV